jgi:electron transfer flavoprotein alpha subunit
VSARFTVVGRNDDETGPLLGVLEPHASCRVLHLTGWSPNSQPAVPGSAIQPLLMQHDVLILGSGQDQRDLAGWLAITLDAPVVWAVEAVREADSGVEFVRTAGRQRITQRVDGGPAIALARPAHVDLADRASPAETQHVQLDGRFNDVVVLAAPEPADDGLTPLFGAKIVVSVGRGIGGPDNLDVFRHLAARLGAALGASRVAVDSGWLPFGHQVGQTGASIAPDVYLAFGISGAVQHLAGIRGSKTIVAVNTDPDAPLCKSADLVLVGDAVTIASTLLRLLGGRDDVA